MLYLLSDTAKMNDTLFFETFVEVILMGFFRHKSCESPNPTPISFVAFLMKIHGKACERQMEKELYRIYFTPEMEVFYMLFERCHTKKRKRTLKQHIKYINFRSNNKLDHPVVVHIQGIPLEVECESDETQDFYFTLMGVPCRKGRRQSCPVASTSVRPGQRIICSSAGQDGRRRNVC